jgi:2-oxoisovalerate dehydrogenase E2 component (dihydrolipoyl transacylase)
VLHEFRMPDAGEGLTEAEVLTWRVAVGDDVSVNQILLEVETEKAAVELPSPYSGKVVELLAEPGQTVPVGQPIIRIDDGLATGGSPPSAVGEVRGSGPAARAEAPAPATDPAGDPKLTPEGPGEGQAVLVGYGVKVEPTPRRRPRITPHGADHVEAGPPGEAARPVRHGGLELGRAVERRLGAGDVRAKPPVRRLARDLSVDLADVVPTGPGGTITHDDVARAAAQPHPMAPGLAPALVAAPEGGSRTVALSHVARMMGRAMTASAFTAPHVTEWVDVDVSAMTALISAARARSDFAGLPLTPLTFAALGLVRAALSHPTINASLDESGENLLVHNGVHLGIAVDSTRGLVVPRVPDAHLLDLRAMADALGRLIETARAGRARPEDLRGSTITLTNVGVFGVDAGTPILNPGQVAILALGRVMARPWVVDGHVVARDVVTLSLSFDHRVIDGALGSRVLRDVADFMADPATALVLG